jgi:hypothetical protein
VTGSVPRKRRALDRLLAVLSPRPLVGGRVSLADALGTRGAHVGQRHVYHPLVSGPPPPASRRRWRPGTVCRNAITGPDLPLAAGLCRRRHRRPVAPLAVHTASARWIREHRWLINQLAGEQFLARRQQLPTKRAIKKTVAARCGNELNSRRHKASYGVIAGEEDVGLWARTLAPDGGRLNKTKRETDRLVEGTSLDERSVRRRRLPNYLHPYDLSASSCFL